MRHLQLLDGSYIQTCHVTRYHITEDITKKEAFDIRASVVGPAHPFIIARYETRSEAQARLDVLIVDLDPDLGQV
jgi:hypothetical protein